MFLAVVEEFKKQLLIAAFVSGFIIYRYWYAPWF